MINQIKLDIAVKYCDKKIKTTEVTLDTYITTDNILQNKMGISRAINLPPQGAIMPYYKQNNILVGNIRPYLKKIWFADRSGGCSADVLNLEVNEGYDPKFIYYGIFRDDFFNHMMKGSKGSKMPRGDKNQIMNFLIPDFKLSKQQQISGILSSLDAKIVINNKINAELEQMAKTLYDYWFVQFDFPDENGKPYKSSGGKMVCNEELKREIPVGWEVRKIGNIFEVKRGKNITRKTIQKGNIPVIAAGLEPSCYHNISNTTAPVITISGSGANAGFTQLHNINIWASDCSFIDISTTKYVYIIYVFLKNRQKEIYDMQKGSAQPHVYPKDIMDLKITTDINYSTFDRFLEIVSPQFDMIGKLKQENQKLAELRDWLLPMLMNGQVKVQA